MRCGSWAFRMVLVSYVREARVRRVQLLKRDLLRCCLAHSRASRAPTSADALFRMIVWRFAYGLRYARPLVGMSYLKLCVDEPRAPRAVGQRQQQHEKLNMAQTLPQPWTSACCLPVRRRHHHTGTSCGTRASRWRINSQHNRLPNTITPANSAIIGQNV